MADRPAGKKHVRKGGYTVSSRQYSGDGALSSAQDQFRNFIDGVTSKFSRGGRLSQKAKGKPADPDYDDDEDSFDDDVDEDAGPARGGTKAKAGLLTRIRSMVSKKNKAADSDDDDEEFDDEDDDSPAPAKGGLLARFRSMLSKKKKPADDEDEEYIEDDDEDYGDDEDEDED